MLSLLYDLVFMAFRTFKSFNSCIAYYPDRLSAALALSDIISQPLRRL